MSEDAQGPITMIRTPVDLEYNISAGPDLTLFLRGLKEEKKLYGRRSPNGDVYIPPRGACPVTGQPMLEEVEVSDHGTVTTFCLINIPIEGQELKPPYVFAAIILDGASLPLFHMIAGIAADEARMGMRVKANWKPDDELVLSLESINYFEPSGEPDADYDSYKEHL